MTVSSNSPYNNPITNSIESSQSVKPSDDDFEFMDSTTIEADATELATTIVATKGVGTKTLESQTQSTPKEALSHPLSDHAMIPRQLPKSSSSTEGSQTTLDKVPGAEKLLLKNVGQLDMGGGVIATYFVPVYLKAGEAGQPVQAGRADRVAPGVVPNARIDFKNRKVEYHQDVPETLRNVLDKHGVIYEGQHVTKLEVGKKDLSTEELQSFTNMWLQASRANEAGKKMLEEEEEKRKKALEDTKALERSKTSSEGKQNEDVKTNEQMLAVSPLTQRNIKAMKSEETQANRTAENTSQIKKSRESNYQNKTREQSKRIQQVFDKADEERREILERDVEEQPEYVKVNTVFSSQPELPTSLKGKPLTGRCLKY